MTETAAGPLADAGTLVGDSWRLFRGRFGLLMLVAGLGSLATLFCALAPFAAVGALQLAGPTGPLPWAVAAVVGLSAALWAGSWAQVAACDVALAEEGAALSLGAVLKRAWPRVAAFSWVCLLYLVIVGGGLFLFVLPGLYLAASLVFAPFAALEEGVTGLAALERSLQYSRGRFGALSLRLAVLGLLGGLPSLVPLVGPILGAVLSPLPLVALAVLYRDVRRAPAGGAAARWPLALAAAGWLWPAYVTARVLPALVAQWPELKAQAAKLSSLDPQQAQKLLDALQQGQGTLDAALLAAKMAQTSPAVDASTSAVAAVPPAPPAAAPGALTGAAPK